MTEREAMTLERKAFEEWMDAHHPLWRNSPSGPHARASEQAFLAGMHTHLARAAEPECAVCGGPNTYDRESGVCRECQDVDEHNTRPPEPARDAKLPKDAPLGLLVSMAIRFDHGLGVQGYYDAPIFGVEGVGHAKRLRATISTMRQLYEEVSGHGFYSPEKEASYAAMAQEGE